MKYQFAVRNRGADPNIKLYQSPIDAYAELERRLSYGLDCQVLDRHEWDSDVMQHCVNNYRLESKDD